MTTMHPNGTTLNTNVLANFPPELQVENLKNQSASLQRSRIRELAKKLRAQGHGRLTQLASQIVQWLGHRDLRELNRKVREEQAASIALVQAPLVEVLEIPLFTSIAYRLRIDGSVWKLLVTKSGPELQLESRPSGGKEFEERFHSTQLGLFPAIISTSELVSKEHQTSKEEWALTRYGTYRTLTLDFLSDQAVAALGQHFGIPVYKKRKLSSKQQVESEICFLCSPAFKALRLMFRTGQIPLPNVSEWRYGLCSLWCHFVAASDSDFENARSIAETYMKPSLDPRYSLRELDLKLAELWETVPNLGDSKDGLQYGFSELISSWRKPKRRAAEFSRNMTGTRA